MLLYLLILFTLFSAILTIINQEIEDRLEEKAMMYADEPSRRHFEYHTFYYDKKTKRGQMILTVLGSITIAACIAAASESITLMLYMLPILLWLTVLSPRMWSDKYIWMEDHQLVYAHRQTRLYIPLCDIQQITVHSFRLYVTLTNKECVKLPLGFKHQHGIYALLRYHRPDTEPNLIQNPNKNNRT